MSSKKIDYVSNIQHKKTANKKTIDKYLSIESEKKAFNMEYCFNQFYAEKYKHKTNELEKFKSRPLTTCKNKFCHICSYIKSKKTFVKTYQAIENMKNDNHKFIAYHLTLTIKNPYTFDLSTSYDTMNKAFHNFIHKFKELDNYLIGWQCGREISQSKAAKTNNEFHPHIHCLLLLKPDFYNPVSRNQKITKNQFRDKWTKSCSFYNIEAYQIEFKKIKANEDFINLENSDGENDPFLSAIAEVSKYPTKPADLQNMSLQHFDILDKVLHNKRQSSSGGLLKQYLAKQKEDEILHIDNWELIEILFCNYSTNKYNVKILNKQQQESYLSKIELEKMINETIKNTRKIIKEQSKL